MIVITLRDIVEIVLASFFIILFLVAVVHTWYTSRQADKRFQEAKRRHDEQFERIQKKLGQ